MKSTFFKYLFFLPRSKTKNALWAMAILMLGLILTGVATIFVIGEVENETNQKFTSVCNEIKIKTADRLRTCELLLRSSSAFLSASEPTSREDWKAFYELSNYQKNLPGVQGLGYSILIPKNQVLQHIQKIRKEGFPEYTIKPAGDRDFYTSVIYLEPFTKRNLLSFGYDMFSDPTRRKAMVLSRDSDCVVLSGNMIPEQKSVADQHTGILMIVPVFRIGMPVHTVDQRRAAIKGWVFSPYRIYNLLPGILGRWDLKRENRIRLQIYEDSLSVSSLLYDSQKNDTQNTDNSQFRTLTLPIKINGGKWIMLFRQSNGEDSAIEGKVIIVFVSGILISILIFLLSLSLFNTRYWAHQIAKNLTLELNETKERLISVLENSLDASYKRNLKTQRYEYLSPVFSGISGYQPEEIETLKIENVVAQMHPDDMDEVNRIIAKVLSDTTVNNYQLEYRFKHKDGQYRWFQDRFTVVRDMNLQPAAMIGSVGDITDRKNAEEALLKEKLLLRTIIDNIPDSIYCMDLACRKTLANLTDLRYMGVKSEAEVLGKDDFAFYPKEFAEAFFALDQSVIQTGKPLLNCEESLIDENGLKRYLLSSKLPMLDKDGRIIGLLGIGRDITERKKAEEEVKLKNEELQKLNTAKDKFFSIIAHDLRSPFNGFLGLSQILVEELPTLAPEEIQMIAVSMQNSATTLYRLLENLLEWAKMQQGLITFKPEILPLKPLIDHCLAIKQLKAQSKEIEIINHIPDEIEVYADSNMLQTIIRNLVSNSVKFTNKGGEIIVSAKTKKDNIVEINIKDNGIGMSREMIEGLFHLEVNTSRKGTEGETSTGLGLIICKDFVEKHGGKLRVKSEEGKGSTFYFTIPGKDI